MAPLSSDLVGNRDVSISEQKWAIWWEGSFERKGESKEFFGGIIWARISRQQFVWLDKIRYLVDGTEYRLRHAKALL